jgi:glucose/arabinose dehydrogenase
VTAPAGFTDTVVFALPHPTGMGWTPDGRMLITQDEGLVRVVRNGVLKPTAALNLSSRACTDGERGLGSVLVDPAFATNRYIYLYWTHNKHNFCGTGTAQTP